MEHEPNAPCPTPAESPRAKEVSCPIVACKYYVRGMRGGDFKRHVKGVHPGLEVSPI